MESDKKTEKKSETQDKNQIEKKPKSIEKLKSKQKADEKVTAQPLTVGMKPKSLEKQNVIAKEDAKSVTSVTLPDVKSVTDKKEQTEKTKTEHTSKNAKEGKDEQKIRSIASQRIDDKKKSRIRVKKVRSKPMSVANLTIDEQLKSVKLNIKVIDQRKEDKDQKEDAKTLKYDSTSLYFRDGQKRIDFILAYSTVYTDRNMSKYYRNAREVFEKNLCEEGLLIEYKGDSTRKWLTYVKIHCPWNVLCRYAEVMGMKMPLKRLDRSQRVFTSSYSREKEYLFEVPKEKELFFTTSQRSQIVYFILKRKGFSVNSNDASAFGISKLLQDGVYCNAYPLHEGKMVVGEVKSSVKSPRMQLINSWAKLSLLFRPQPLDEIKNYLGVKVALYYAFLGYYTYMLVPASIIGVLCFFFGLCTVTFDKPSNQICDGHQTPMCPQYTQCTKNDCRFSNISTICFYAKLSYLFDNPGTVFFAVFMSLWATYYVEMWRNYSANITCKWDLPVFDVGEDYPRPEYLAYYRNEKKILNPITRMIEPDVPFWTRKFPYHVLSVSIVLLLITLAFALVLAVIMYRIAISATLGMGLSKWSPMIVSITASTLNLINILILNEVYAKLANFLTELEKPRTKSEYENSLTLKLYLLQFINYYAAIFYIAFIKGRFVTHPGDLPTTDFSTRTLEECIAGNCFVELSISMGIILIGLQAANAIIETSLPFLEFYFNRWMSGKSAVPEAKLESDPQWESDYLLANWHSQALFYEYLEMVIQFGFITFFAAAFPLAPLFALINNSLEIRLDARKMLTAMKRPVAKREKDIGIWHPIMSAISRIAILCNASIIAFSSDFVPRVYHYWFNGSLQNYLQGSLSFYDTKALSELHKINYTASPRCMYFGYRYPPGHLSAMYGQKETRTYGLSVTYYEILVLRLAFVVVFENIIAMVAMMIRGFIPNTPKSLQKLMRQQEYHTSELILQKEVRRAKQESVMDITFRNKR